MESVKVGMDELAKSKRVELAYKLGVDSVRDKVLYDSMVDGPCIFINNSFGFNIIEDMPKVVGDTVAEFEKSNQARVISVISSVIKIDQEVMHLEAYIYQCLNDEEYGLLDYWDISENEIGVMAYVKNVTCDWCSDYGSIGIKFEDGVIVRTM